MDRRTFLKVIRDVTGAVVVSTPVLDAVASMGQRSATVWAPELLSAGYNRMPDGTLLGDGMKVELDGDATRYTFERVVADYASTFQKDMHIGGGWCKYSLTAYVNGEHYTASLYARESSNEALIEEYLESLFQYAPEPSDEWRGLFIADGDHQRHEEWMVEEGRTNLIPYSSREDGLPSPVGDETAFLITAQGD